MLREEVVKVATPPLSTAVPSFVLESLNVTFRVGELERPNDDTVAVNVTDWPRVEGF
jgi:hypothetical protein